MDSTDGVLLVDKPAGITSHDVVAIARRALGIRRIGHAGTLDPFATGLLILLTGRATRLLPYLDDEPKVYDATIRFGTETDTDDGTGAATRPGAAPREQAVRAALPALTGPIDQLPPDYSAKQVGGQRAYDAARRGAPLALTPVRVTVHAWEWRAWREQELDATITCSGGTYIRALARDLGRATDSAAHLSALRRTGAGAFRVRDAVTLDQLKGGAAAVCPPRDAVATLPAVVLSEADGARVAHGMAVPVAAHGESMRAALVDAEGALVAIAEREGAEWRPRVVLRDA
jgi:tRNA pseudouridine55 synthase